MSSSILRPGQTTIEEKVGLKRFSLRLGRFGHLRSGNRLGAVPPPARKQVFTQQYQNAKAALLSDIDDATIIGMTEELIAQAVALLERFPCVVRMLYMSPAPRLVHRPIRFRRRSPFCSR
jgi:hypothetical protein